MKRTLALLLVSSLTAVGKLGAQSGEDLTASSGPPSITSGQPIELNMQRAGGTTLDVRELPRVPVNERERPEMGEPPFNPLEAGGGRPASTSIPSVAPGANAPAPAPIMNFEGLDRFTWGSGSPPDTTGDVGPDHYIQSVNSSVGIYNKTTGAQIAAFTYDTLMSQGSFGNLCDTENFGDPIVLYDSFEDRWVLTDFAFVLAGGFVAPPAFQCFAVSKSADPVAGGWWFYSIQVSDQLNDYPKLGVWTDGIYMSANMFSFGNSGGFQFNRVWALNKAQMYAGAPTVQIISFEETAGDFTLLPSNARLQTGTPPPGTPNYFVSSWVFLDALTVYKFHVDWERTSLSTFTGPEVPLAATSWPNSTVANAGQPGTATLLDVLQIRAMMQNQYTNYGGTESLWTSHTVRRALGGLAAPRWYQVDVTGGTVAANLPQAATWDPDAANVINRFMGSLALDRDGNLALGYSTSHSAVVAPETAATIFPSIRYAGRLAADPINTFSQTEQILFTGTASQTGSSRWGDYSTMSLDPEDGCTFWFTSEFANPLSQTFDQRWRTQIGSFKYAECTPLGAGGTLSGTVTATVGGAPISGASVELGSRTTTTDGSGDYSFTSLPAGSYPSVAVSAPGFVPESVGPIVVTDSATTTQDFALDAAPTSACLTDTTLADFQTGVQSKVDLTTSPDEVILLDAVNNLNQQNTTLGNSGGGITTGTWAGQTFTPSVSGPMRRVDMKLFCSGCTGTTPALTLSLRATSGGLPTGADLASDTLTGFAEGFGVWRTVNFAAPATVTAGTQYAIVIRPTVNPAPGTYAWLRSGNATLGADVYAGGTRVIGATSGTVWSVSLTGGVSTDFGFKVYIDTGFTSGEQVSSLKDSNPPTGYTQTWTTLSWNATVPANTDVKFQVAASNSEFGPFNFVGPDTTAGTFFTTSGASLSQFNGNRYLRYKAYLSSTDNNVTPTLDDVTVCFAAVPPPPDLSMTKSDGGASVAPGGTVSYTLTYANSSVGGATGVVITDVVPANTTFNAGASTAGWACVPDGNAGSTCTLAIGAVAANSGNLTATFAVTVVSPVAGGVDQISNTATIADDGANGADPTANNSGSDTTPVTAVPDLSLTKSDGGVTAAPGDTVSYILTYANAGNQGASGVTLSDTVPTNTTFSPGASTVGWVCAPDNTAGSVCTLSVGTIAAGSGNQAATFAVIVDDPVSDGATQIGNTATIADDGANGADPTADNSGSDTTPVSPTGFYSTITPCRLVDTREPAGPYGAPPIAALTDRTFVAWGQCGIPVTAVAVSFNITVVNGTADGALRAYAAGAIPPIFPLIHYAAGQIRSNNGVITLGAAGDFVLKSDQSTGTVDVIVDLTGYFE